MLIGVALNYIVPEQVFVYVTSISLVGSLWTWALIVIAHLGYRKAVAIGAARPVAWRMPGSPYTNWFVVAFLVLVAIWGVVKKSKTSGMSRRIQMELRIRVMSPPI